MKSLILEKFANSTQILNIMCINVCVMTNRNTLQRFLTAVVTRCLTTVWGIDFVLPDFHKLRNTIMVGKTRLIYSHLNCENELFCIIFKICADENGYHLPLSHHTENAWSPPQYKPGISLHGSVQCIRASTMCVELTSHDSVIQWHI